MRDDHAAARAIPSDPARPCRAEPAGDDPVREVWPASAAQPPERALTPRRRGSEPVDAGRSCRRLRRGLGAAVRADRTPMCSPPSACMATTRRFRSSPKARRPPVASGSMSATIAPSAAGTRRRRCTTPRAIERGEHPERHLSRLGRRSASRRLQRLQQALSTRAQTGADRRSAVLEPCQAQVLRTRRHRRERATGQERARRSRRWRWRPSNAST